MARDPLTPDCGVKGCKRAEWRLGLCREHRKLVPVNYGMECMVAVMNAGHAATQKWTRRAIREANAALR